VDCSEAEEHLGGHAMSATRRHIASWHGGPLCNNPSARLMDGGDVECWKCRDVQRQHDRMSALEAEESKEYDRKMAELKRLHEQERTIELLAIDIERDQTETPAWEGMEI